MIAFAAAGFVLANDEALLTQIQQSIVAAAPAGIGGLLNDVINQAIAQRQAVGIIGLLGALYSGLGWMSNLREALSSQWGQRNDPPPLLRKLAVDLLALIGLGLALVASFAVIAIGGLAPQIVKFLGLDGLTWLSPVIRLVVVVVSLLANALVFLWVIARLPREPVTWRSAAKAALAAAVGFQVINQIMVFYLAKITDSPTGALFGPVLGLMIFIFTVSRFLLFLTAWAATAKENMVEAPIAAPGPSVVRTELTLSNRPSSGVTAGLVGAGAVAGVLLGAFTGFTRRRR
jgi:membrane protein